MFPTAANHYSFSLLTYTEFITSVLVPYTTILLIQANQTSSFENAWSTWHSSGVWGMVNHPDQEAPSPVDTVPVPVKPELLNNDK